jgi:hypothetical protein
MNTYRFAPIVILFGILLAACSPQAMATPAPLAAIETQMVQSTSAPAATPGPGAVSADFVAPSSAMIIKDAQLEMTVRDTDIALSQITMLAADDGGYVLSSKTWYVDGYKNATLELGVPSASFEKALNTLRDLAMQVTQENTSGQDVSADYTDLQSKLNNLEATAARVRDFLKNAQTTEDSLRINGQLSELEGQIEQVKGKMNYYQGRSAVSTITVTLHPQLPTPPPPAPTPTPTPAPDWNPGRTFTHASGVLVDMTQSLVDALIWIVVVLGPLALAAALVIGGALRLRRLFKR